MYSGFTSSKDSHGRRGALNSGTMVADAWMLGAFTKSSGRDFTWSRLSVPEKPAFSARMLHTIHFLPVETGGDTTMIAVIFGGCMIGTADFDGKDRQSYPLQCTSPPTEDTTLTYMVNSSTPHSSEWDYMRYEELGGVANGPSPRYSSAMSSISGSAGKKDDQASLILFGGCTSIACGIQDLPRDTWQLRYQKVEGAPLFKWTQLSLQTPQSLSGRRRNGMVSSRAGSSVLIMSGEGSTDGRSIQNFSDTWQLTQNLTEWQDITTPSSPQPRSEPAMASAIVGNTSKVAAVVFGGEGDEQKEILSDTWALLYSHNDTYVWSKILTRRTNSPPPRMWGQMANIDDKRHAVFLFGGAASSTELLGDSWILEWKASPDAAEGVTGAIWYPVGNRGPQSRFWHSLSSLGDYSGRVLMFGGSTTPPGSPQRDRNPEARFLDDTWIYTPPTETPGIGQWVRITNQDYEWPSGRNSHDMTAISPSRVVMFGGKTYKTVGNESVYLSDETWIFVASTIESVRSSKQAGTGTNAASLGRWYKLDFPFDARVPPSRQEHIMEPMGKGKIIMFGGCRGEDVERDSCSVLLSDTWMLTQSSYSSPDLAASVASNGHTVLSNNGKSLHLEERQYMWHALVPTTNAAPPSARAGHGLAYVGATGKILLYGGNVRLTYKGTTESVKAGDSWFLSDGCPYGTFDPKTSPNSYNSPNDYGCYPCELGKYKSTNGLNHLECKSCPHGITTFEDGRTRLIDCAKCANPLKVNATMGSCIVNFTTTPFQASWVCTQTAWGENCQHACYCSGHGTCNYGTGPNNNGECTCHWSHMWSYNCEQPVFAIIVSLASLGSILGVLKLRSIYRSRVKRTEEQGYLLARELEDGHMAEIGALQEGWRIWEDDLAFKQRIAAGAMGEVWKGSWAMLPERDVAIKKMFLNMSDVVQKPRLSNNARNDAIEKRLQRREKRRQARMGSKKKKKKKKKTSNDSTDLSESLLNSDQKSERIDKRIYVDSSKKEISEVSTMLHSASVLSRSDVVDQAAFSDKEIALLSRLRHRRVVLFHGAGQLSTGQLFLVTEFMHGGDLRSALDRNKKENRLTWHNRVSIAKDIAEGMAFLHERHLIHRDLKSLNVLLDARGRAKIADFGLSRMSQRQRESIASCRASVSGTDNMQAQDSWESMLNNIEYNPTKMTGRQGTAAWMAPELEPQHRESHSGKRDRYSEYSYGVDCYSFGIVMFEIITSRHPWEEINFSYQIIDKVVAGVRPEVTDIETETCVDAGCEWMLKLMKRCWDQDPRRRPPFSEVFRMIEEHYKRLYGEESEGGDSFVSMKGGENHDSMSLDFNDVNFGSSVSDIELSTTNLHVNRSRNHMQLN